MNGLLIAIIWCAIGVAIIYALYGKDEVAQDSRVFGLAVVLRPIILLALAIGYAKDKIRRKPLKKNDV